MENSLAGQPVKIGEEQQGGEERGENMEKRGEKG